MTEHELLRIIAFLERVRLPFQELIPVAEEDATWNMLLFLVKSHLTGTPVTISALASISKVPVATALRRIHALIERGDIVRKNITETGKRFRLEPSEALLESFLRYARSIKLLLAETFGFRSKADSDEDYYFGGSYFAAQIIPPPRLIESLFSGQREIKFLLNDDNYFLSMRNMWSDFRSNMSSGKNFDLRKLPQLHDRVIENGRRAEIGIRHRRDQCALAGRGGPEGTGDSPRLRTSSRRRSRRSTSIPRSGRWAPGTASNTASRSIARSSCSRCARICSSATGSTTRRPSTRRSPRRGISTRRRRGSTASPGTAGAGMPIASTFMFLMGCCGECILRIPKSSLSHGVDEARGEQLRPQIDSEAGLHVLDYLHELLEVSPPDILEMDWDRRTTSFLSGQTALAYCWTVRAARFETDVSSAVKRRVHYLPQPRGPSGASNNPIGGFLLCIPSNLPEERIELAFEAIAWMTSPEAMKANVQNGFPVAPRFSVSADPEAAATSPIVSIVDRLAKRNMLKAWPRPPVPEYLSLEAILGEEIHSALRGEASDRAALKAAQKQADQVMRAAGYY